jgi:hypothetical protein
VNGRFEKDIWFSLLLAFFHAAVNRGIVGCGATFATSVRQRQRSPDFPGRGKISGLHAFVI